MSGQELNRKRTRKPTMTVFEGEGMEEVTQDQNSKLSVGAYFVLLSTRYRRKCMPITQFKHSNALCGSIKSYAEKNLGLIVYMMRYLYVVYDRG